MDLIDFDFPFDPSLIADHPCEPRDGARLLVVTRGNALCSHRRVNELPILLKPGDLLVANDTKVMAVRLSGRKRPGGGRVEIVLIKALEGWSWEAFIKGRVQPRQVIEIGPEAIATVREREGVRSVVSIETSLSINDFLARYGQMPLPPYMKREPNPSDRRWYQTVFAREEGAIAAPTAGLHFTEPLLHALNAAGIGFASITLHVGPGTFMPVSVSHVEDHVMLAERVVISEETCKLVSEAKARGGRVVAVGTTVVRALEAAAELSGTVRPYQGETNLFILPGYKFRVIDALMTNFHLPRSTLVMLVSAYLGRERLLDTYREAVQERYRFYSYGDAMLIL